MKRIDQTNGSRPARALWVIAVAVAMLLAVGCDEKPQEGESKAQAAARKIRETLILPDDAQYLGAEAKPDQDRVVFNFGSNTHKNDMGAMLKKTMASDKIILESDNTVSYEDPDSRVVTYAWFERDADVFEYQTAVGVAVTPLPGEIKKDPNL